MMTPGRFHTILAAQTLVVVGLASTNWYLKPESAGSWAMGAVSMPVIWVIVTLLMRRRPLESYGEAEGRFFTRSIMAAGSILAAALGIKLARTLGAFDADSLERVWGVVMGAVLVVMGNLMPKTLTPLAAQPRSESHTQSTRRFAGWSFVLAGLAYATVWMVLPVTQANTVAMLICASAVVLVVIRCTWAFSRAASKGSW